MDSKIWDLTPDGGGPPVQVIVGNPREAIAAHPERYTSVAPDGTAQSEMAKLRSDRSVRVAQINKERNEKLSAIAKEQSEKIAAVRKEQADARTASLEKQRADEKQAAEKSGDVPNRDAMIAAIEPEYAAKAELAQHEADQAALAADVPGALVVDRPLKPGIPTRPAPPEGDSEQEPVKPTQTVRRPVV